MKALEKTYCGSIGVEYMHIQDPEQKKEFSYFVKFDAKWQTAATSVPVGAKTSFSHMKIS